MSGPRRIAQLAKIHLAQKDLGLDAETYQDVLVRVTGKSSAKGMTENQLDAVIDEMKRLGFKPRPPTKKTAPVVSRALADEPQHKKIRALWLTLADQGAVKDRSEAALAGFVARLTKVDALQWLTVQQARTVIEALKSWQKRIGGAS